jgi:hypothetical protein
VPLSSTTSGRTAFLSGRHYSQIGAGSRQRPEDIRQSPRLVWNFAAPQLDFLDEYSHMFLLPKHNAKSGAQQEGK